MTQDKARQEEYPAGMSQGRDSSTNGNNTQTAGQPATGQETASTAAPSTRSGKMKGPNDTQAKHTGKKQGNPASAEEGISIFHGGCFMGHLYGSGYGKDEELTRHADRIATSLHQKTGIPLVKRGNSDGLSCGAHHDGPYSFGCSARKRPDGHVTFSAYFESDDGVLMEASYRKKNPSLADAHRTNYGSGPVFASSKDFKTAALATRWLLAMGRLHCPPIRDIANAR